MASHKTVKVLGVYKPTDDFKVIEVPQKPLGPRDLLVQVEAVSVNPVDYKKRGGANSNSVENPLIVGYDAAGVVIGVGSEVSIYKVGDEVIYAGDVNKDGSFAQRQIIDERIVGKKPTSISWHEAAAIPLVGLTAYEGLVEILGIKEENFAQNSKKSILVVGGAGGVGSIVIQIAKNLLGLKVIATASRPESKAYCLKLGADYVINHRNNLEEELKAQNLIGTVDYVYNTSEMTTEYFNQFVSLINPLSAIVGIVGFNQPLNLGPSFMKRVSLTIECMFTKPKFGVNLESQGQIISHLSQKQAEGVLVSTAETIFEFNAANIQEGLAACQRGTNIGKIAFKNVQSYFNTSE